MPILLGVRPGGRDGFAVNAVFWPGRPPARLIRSASFSGVRAVLHDIMGVVGEWGDLTAACIDAPLTWSATPTGRRKADDELAQRVPKWAPKSWFRPPNALPGAVAIQGPALTWALSYEVKHGVFPAHQVYESHARASMSRTVRDLHESILHYRDKDISDEVRAEHIRRVVERFSDSGIVALEAATPQTPEQLEAFVCAVTALGITYPQTGLVTHEIQGGEIRPVGRRSVVVLDAFP